MFCAQVLYFDIMQYKRTGTRLALEKSHSQLFVAIFAALLSCTMSKSWNSGKRQSKDSQTCTKWSNLHASVWNCAGLGSVSSECNRLWLGSVSFASLVLNHVYFICKLSAQPNIFAAKRLMWFDPAHSRSNLWFIYIKWIFSYCLLGNSIRTESVISKYYNKRSF